MTWNPTHRIFADGEVIDVELGEDGGARTQAEHASGERPTWSFDDAEGWLYYRESEEPVVDPETGEPTGETRLRVHLSPYVSVRVERLPE